MLVSSLDAKTWPAASMRRQYRDRGDAENCYDELKNQWGWGCTSRKLAPCRLMANLIALFYNWWNLYVRFYDGEHHREATRSRPLLMSGVARQVQSGGRRTVKVSILHEKGDLVAHTIAAISNELGHIRAITVRWNPEKRWTLLLIRVLRRWLGGKWLPGLPPEAARLERKAPKFRADGGISIFGQFSLFHAASTRLGPSFFSRSRWSACR